jgi:hypothetical protein
VTLKPAYQVFDKPVSIDTKDFQRLSPHLSGWVRLHEILLLDVNEPDLMRLVLIELMGRKRKQIIQRLLGRLAKLQRARYEERISKLL